MKLAEDLLRLAAKGDMKAFEALIIQYEKFIYNIALRIMGNAEDAKDISQEVIIKIYRNLSACGHIEHLRAWMARIAHNTCMDELRRRKGKTAESYDAMVVLGDDTAEKQIVDPAAGPEALLLRKEMAGLIQEGLNLLSDEHRALVVLRDVQGLSYEEIAEAVDIPIGTVKSRISRGRKILKNILLEMMEQN
jgi:RNA polymerase sigma-70 factor (ECF subfamily)